MENKHKLMREKKLTEPKKVRAGHDLSHRTHKVRTEKTKLKIILLELGLIRGKKA